MNHQDRLEFRHEVMAIFQDPFEVFNPFYKVDHLLDGAHFEVSAGQIQSPGPKPDRGGADAVGLRPEETLGRYPTRLSGGQRQRLTVCSGLLLQPRLIIADEPVSMVDASLRATILESPEEDPRRLRYLISLYHPRPDDGLSDLRTTSLCFIAAPSPKSVDVDW